MDQLVLGAGPARMDRLFEGIEDEVRGSRGAGLPAGDSAGETRDASALAAEGPVVCPDCQPVLPPSSRLTNLSERPRRARFEQAPYRASEQSRRGRPGGGSSMAGSKPGPAKSGSVVRAIVSLSLAPLKARSARSSGARALQRTFGVPGADGAARGRPSLCPP